MHNAYVSEHVFFSFESEVIEVDNNTEQSKSEILEQTPQASPAPITTIWNAKVIKYLLNYCIVCCMLLHTSALYLVNSAIIVFCIVFGKW